VSHFR